MRRLFFLGILGARRRGLALLRRADDAAFRLDKPLLFAGVAMAALSAPFLIGAAIGWTAWLWGQPLAWWASFLACCGALLTLCSLRLSAWSVSTGRTRARQRLVEKLGEVQARRERQAMDASCPAPAPRPRARL